MKRSTIVLLLAVMALGLLPVGAEAATHVPTGQQRAYPPDPAPDRAPYA